MDDYIIKDPEFSQVQIPHEPSRMSWVYIFLKYTVVLSPSELTSDS